jgi:MoaA/NifB/PqqE/SkfB family radical SAM enzyme
MKKIKQRISETSNIPAEYKIEVPPMPQAVKIEVTSKCDLRCFFCSVTYKQKDAGNINSDFLYRLLGELKEAGIQEVGLFWLGEPLLVKELPEYVAYAKKIGIPYVFLTTNGRLATVDRIAQLIASGIDSIKVSINASNREDYIKICGVDAFDQVIYNVQHLRELRQGSSKPSIYASTVFDPDSPSTYETLRPMIEPYVDEYYPLRLYGKASYKQKIDAGGENAKNISKRTLESMLPCWSLFTLPHISYDGYLSACYCDHDHRLYMADLKTMSFKDAWHSAPLIELRRKHLLRTVQDSPCKGCIAYEH